MRRATVFAVFVFLFALSLAAQNFPERPVSAPAFFHNSELEYAAASDGNDFLIVGYRAGLVAHRVTASGNVLDGAGIRIHLPREARDARVLGVFWTEEAYTIVMQASIPTEPATPPDYRVYVARIDREGRLTGAPRMVLSGRFLLESAGSSGSRIVLAGDRIAVLDARGELLESNIPMPTDFSWNLNYRVTWNGSGFMVTWIAWRVEGPRYVNVAPLDANGRPTGARTSILADFALYSVIASDGTDYVVVYKQTAPNADYALHVSASGEILGRRPLPSFARSSIAWNGTNYILAAHTDATVPLPAVLRLDRTGASIDSAPVSVSSAGTPFSSWPIVTASNGRQALVSWQEGTDSTAFRSFGTLVGGDGKPGSIFPLGVTPTVQQSPDVAIGGGIVMVVWEESDAVYASRLTLSGELIEDGVRLSTAPAGAPRVVFDGQTFVIAWTSMPFGSFGSVVTSHVSPDGTVLAGAEKPVVQSCSDDFDIATDGTTALVVARQCSARLAAARVHRSGIADPIIAISPGNMQTASPRVAWNGQGYLVVWRELFPIPSHWETLYRADIRAARVSPSLTLLDPEPFGIAVSSIDDAIAPLVASNGTDFMVAWTAGTVRARTVKGDATLGETMANVAEGRGTDLMWNGRRYALAFTAADDLFLMPLGAGSAAAINQSADSEFSATLAPVNGAIVAAYVREATEAPYGGVRRVFVKGIASQPRSRAVR